MGKMSEAHSSLEAVLAKRGGQDFSDELAKTGWYHSMELPSGVIPGFMSLDELRQRWSQFPLPDDLTGARLLDIGTWDGWFAFEAERRGAEVVAVDIAAQENFYHAHRERRSSVRYEVCEVYKLPELQLGTFDYTLFLGVLYHLRHPLRALEIVCALTKQLAVVDSFIVLDEGGENHSPIPWMEFYETHGTRQPGGQLGGTNATLPARTLPVAGFRARGIHGHQTPARAGRVLPHLGTTPGASVHRRPGSHGSHQHTDRRFWHKLRFPIRRVP